MAYEQYKTKLPSLSGMFERDKLRALETEQRNIETSERRDAEQFNFGNALTRAVTAYIAGGGTPLAIAAAGLSALGAERGREYKPLESAISGATTGITAKAMPGKGDLLETLKGATDTANLGTTLPFIQSINPKADSLGILGSQLAKQEAKNEYEQKQQQALQKLESDRELELLKNERIDPNIANQIARNRYGSLLPEIGSESIYKEKQDSKKDLGAFIASLPTGQEGVWPTYQALKSGDYLSAISKLPADVQDDAKKAYNALMKETNDTISSSKRASYTNAIMQATPEKLSQINNAIQKDTYLNPDDRAKLYSEIDSKQTKFETKAERERNKYISDQRYATQLGFQKRSEQRAIKNQDKSNKKAFNEQNKQALENYTYSVENLFSDAKTNPDPEKVAIKSKKAIKMILDDKDLKSEQKTKLIARLRKLETKISVIEYKYK